MSPWTSKRECRIYFTSLLNESHKGSQDSKLLALTPVLRSFLKTQVGIWGAYKAMSQEADVAPALQESPHIQWVFPRVQGDQLSFYKAQKFEKSPLGFYEPSLVGAESVSAEKISGILVPGLAFNAEGVRLGRGKGYYDRFLENYNGKKIGVGFSSQFWQGKLPSESHDVKMNYVITNEKIITCSMESFVEG